MRPLLDWIVGSWRTIGFVAVSTVLIYLSVVVALRVGERRTLAEMSAFDFAVAVAVGSIIGRVSTARSPTYVQGLVALLTLLVSHYLITFGRARSERVKRWVERPPRVVVRDGEILPSELRREHLTEDDLMRTLRERDVHALDEVELVVVETKGGLSVLRRGARRVEDPIRRDIDVPARPARRADGRYESRT